LSGCPGALGEDSLAEAAFQAEELDAFAERSELWDAGGGEFWIVGFG
jgi:hypothetical protein